MCGAFPNMENYRGHNADYCAFFCCAEYLLGCGGARYRGLDFFQQESVRDIHETLCALSCFSFIVLVCGRSCQGVRSKEDQDMGTIHHSSF